VRHTPGNYRQRFSGDQAYIIGGNNIPIAVALKYLFLVRIVLVYLDQFRRGTKWIVVKGVD